MTSRVTFSQMTSHVQQQLFDNFGKLEKLQEQLSTGKRILRGSDDPIDATNAMEMRTNLSQLDQYKRNMQDGIGYMSTVDASLNSGNSMFHTLREKALQGASDTNTAANRKLIFPDVRAMLDQLVAMSNTTFKGDYVFSGANTQVPPYEMHAGQSLITTGLTVGTLGLPIQMVDTSITNSNDNPNGNANAYDVIPNTLSIGGLTEGTDYQVDYVKGTITFTAPGVAALALAGGAGINMNYSWVRRNEADLEGKVNREIEQGVTEKINSTASEVFGSRTETSSWDTIINLLDGLHNNQVSKITGSIGQIDTVFQRYLSAQGNNGARINHFESTTDRGDLSTVNSTQLLSQLEDIDFTEATTQFSIQQSAYNASLKAAAQAIQNTLANFL